MEKNKNIIVITEDSNLISSLKSFRDYSFTFISSLEDIFSEINDICPHVIIIDRISNGQDMSRNIEIIIKNFDIPVLYFSNENYIDSSSINCIKKPVMERELKTIVEIALYKHITDKQLREYKKYTDLRIDIWKIAADKELSEEELIQKLLNIIGPALNVNRACFNKFYGDELICVSQWCDIGFKPTIGVIIPSNLAKYFLNDSYVLYNRESALRAVPEILHPVIKPIISTMEHVFHIESLMIIPYYVNSKIEGLISLHICKNSKRKFSWSEDKKNLLDDMINIISRSIAQKRVEYELQASEKRYRQAQKMEAIGTLAGGIAHDFNNILAAIIGYTELTRLNMPKDSIPHQRLSRVIVACNRAKDLVMQILTFSRQSEQNIEPLQISIVVKEVLKLLRATLPVNIQIRKKIMARDSMVMADTVQVHQLLMNLCTNSYHAMREKGGILEVNLSDADVDEKEASEYHELKPGAYVKLTVKDNGQGMDKEVMDRIFDPFFTTKPTGEGTGMGLSVVHGIIKSFNGVITVDSKPGKGTIFSVFFPRILCEPKSNNDKDNEDEIPQGKGHILLVDDEKDIVTMQELLLKHIGYNVTAKTCSKEAFKCFKNKPDSFDIVITDQMMPGMTGLNLSKKILDIRPDIPIILCTGYSELVNQEMAIQSGIKKFLLKPVDSNFLAHTIYELLNKNSNHTIQA